MRKGGLNKIERSYLAELGANLKKIRTAKGYSQDRLCLEASFSRGTIFKIERGQVNPQILTLAKIAQVLGVPMRKLTDINLPDESK